MNKQIKNEVIKVLLEAKSELDSVDFSNKDNIPRTIGRMTAYVEIALRKLGVDVKDLDEVNHPTSCDPS